MSNMSDRDFVKNFSLMIGTLVALAVVIFVIAQIMGSTTKTAAADMEDSAIAARIKPVGEVSIAGMVAAKVLDKVVPAAQAADGKATYDMVCFACHGTGAAGAPLLGKKDDWAPRIAQGKDTLYKHAIEGYQGKKGFMPAKGGNPTVADADVKAAVDFIVSKSQ